MAIAEYQQFHPTRPSVAEAILNEQEEFTEYLDFTQLFADAAETSVSSVWPTEENPYNYRLTRRDQSIGAAAVNAVRVRGKSGYREYVAEIKAFDTDPSNHHSAYFALITETMAAYPHLRKLVGIGGIAMASKARDLSGDLPDGWDFKLTHQQDPQNGVTTVGHTFIRTNV